MKKTVFVLGMHRSGTSATAGMLTLAGLDPGRSLIPAQNDNPKGFYENLEIVEIHDRLLQDINSEYFDLKRLKAGWLESQSAITAKEKIKSVLKTQFQKNSIKLIKDPRLCRLFPIWMDGDLQLGKVSVLFVLRHPMESAYSLVVRDKVSLSHALGLWLRYNLDAERYSRSVQRFVVHYPHFLENWETELTNISKNLSLGLENLSTETHQKISSFIDSDLNHQHGSRGAESPNAVPDYLVKWCLEAYQALQTVSDPKSQEILEKIRYDFNLSFDNALHLRDQDHYIFQKILVRDEMIRKHEEELKNVYNSLSWRVTYGLRYVNKVLFGRQVFQRRS